VTGWQLESVAPAAVVMDLELVFGISSAAVVGSGAGD
jgi:hypothetical protein